MKKNNNIENKHSSIPTLKLMLWIACGSIAMFFTAFTSAYLVQKSSSYWEKIDLPSGFLLSCGIVFFISAAAHLAKNAIKKEKMKAFKGFIALTFIAAVSFIIVQCFAAIELMDAGNFLLNEQSMAGPWLYIIGGAHALHIILGLGFILALMLFVAFDKNMEQNKLRAELCATYLHFMGGVWIYLYLFLVINH